MYENIICPGQPEASAQSAISTTGPTYIFSNPSDPFLGPPYPPTGYQMNEPSRAGGITLLTWTVPDVIIDVNMLYRFDPFIIFEITIENYEYPDWAVGTPYIPNQRVTFGGTRWVSLSNNTGKQPNLFTGTDWTPDPTFFELYKHNGTDYVKLADSNANTPTIEWDWDTMTFIAQLQSQGAQPWAFYIVANAGISATVQSNIFGFTDTCTIPAPTNFVDLGHPLFSVADIDWDPVTSQPPKDYIVAYGTTPGGPYTHDWSIFTAIPNNPHGGSILFNAPGTFYAIVAARLSATCVSPPSNELTFTVPF